MDSRDQKKTTRQKLISSICTGQISHTKWVSLSLFIPHRSFFLFTFSCYFHHSHLSLSFTRLNGWMGNKKSQLGFFLSEDFTVLYEEKHSEQMSQSSLISSWTLRRRRSCNISCCCSLSSTPRSSRWCSFSLSNARPDIACLIIALWSRFK